MKKVVLCIIFILPTILMLTAVFSRHKEVSFDVQYTNTVSQWQKRTFVPLRPYDGAILSQLSRVNIENGEILTPAQRQGLLNNILVWFKAYSAGTEQSYLAFRFPADVPWQWKRDATQTMSNYFVNGIVFDTTDLREAWMRKYGNPDRIAEMAPYANAAKNWTIAEGKEIRARWIAKYGDGSNAKKAVHPTDPFEQWLTIARESSGNNWWSNYWTGACVDEMVIRITRLTSPPKPLYEYQFGPIHHRTGYDVTARFPNMGIGELDRKSYIRWKFTYEDIIKRQGSIISANIFCMFRRLHEYPQPALLRLVYWDEYKTWVPFEMVNGNPMKGQNTILYF